MTVQLSLEDVENQIHPHSVIETLDSLKDCGLISSWGIDFRNGVITIDVPKDVEVREIISGFEQLPDPVKSVKRDTRGDN